jgi:ATP-dependent Lhr-like helicase
LVKEKGKVKQVDTMGALKKRREAGAEAGLPEPFAGWFAARGWRPYAHQLQLLHLAGERRDTLLIAPTGGGKTLAGFLPSLVDLNWQGAKPQAGIHTLYVSPLKALAVDIARNLTEPVAEMGLLITLETRTRDTPPSRRQRQRLSPPHILLTTPEQIALMLSHRDAASLFGGLRTVIIDELHALATTKRGDLLALDLGRLRTHSPDLRAIGLSATVARPSELAAFLVGHEGQARTKLAEIVEAGPGPKADIAILDSEAELPWAGHSARYALPEIYEAIKAHRMSLIFVNTRSQAEMLFHALWRYNDDNLPIALHHGSLDVGQRRKVEAAMVAGKLRARPRHRLGRRRSRHQCRRAERGEQACPAHWPRQSPARRAEQGSARAGEQLRGGGMPGSPRGSRGRRAGHGALAAWCARCARPARARHGLLAALRFRAALP